MRIKLFKIRPVWLKSAKKWPSYKQKLFKGLQKHFTGNFAKKDEKNEFWICKLANNMKISKPIIYLKTNIIYAQDITLVVLTVVDFQWLKYLKTFEDPSGILTMYQVIPIVSAHAAMVKYLPSLPKIVIFWYKKLILIVCLVKYIHYVHISCY